ncbi:hypothetical protein B0J12DRAFT_561705 [Macrophomina phaseolina]|uniref:Short-chain dehydrogenase/reductase SDR n=1 Tax=Macrophomina phaseolina TaxID=35725 RepID=A0ABQ8GTW6_9PEZI|nr:hypothetical protein B0J12DRAFT_561705 [Macrophomina phaseolina]
MNYLITGAARGIGRGLTRTLLSRGHRVYLLDANSAELENTLGLASSWAAKSPSASSSSSPSDRPFNGAVVDLADRAALKHAVKQADSSFFHGRLDVLVNNAFATPHVWSAERRMDDEDDAIEREWDTKIAVGLTAPFLLARLCVPMLKAARGEGEQRPPGCIVNVSSTRAWQAEPNHEAYSAAKAGLLGLTRSMAVSLGEAYGIRVNAVTPGWVDVDDENAAADREGRRWGQALGEADHAWHPAGRVGRVEDVARAVLFLAESGFMTAEEVVLDGGVSRKMVYPEE